MWRAIAMHDNWLGKLKLEDMTLSTHPFYEKLFTYSDKRQIPKDVPFDENDPDNLGEVREKGWAPIDVLGDGNCGYYSLILGLENIGDKLFSAGTGPPNMETNFEWQSKVVDLRMRLGAHSRHLLQKIYPPGNRQHDWWWFTEATEEKDQATLSRGFTKRGFSRLQYFTSLRRKTEYHMRPYWTAIVFASLFKMRVIVYYRQKGTDMEGNERKVKYAWSTVVIEYNAPEDTKEQPHVLFTIHEEKLERMPDVMYKEKPMIELLFLGGYNSDGSQVPQHYQCLRRVLCDDVPNIPGPTPETLYGYLTKYGNPRNGTTGSERVEVLIVESTEDGNSELDRNKTGQENLQGGLDRPLEKHLGTSNEGMTTVDEGRQGTLNQGIVSTGTPRLEPQSEKMNDTAVPSDNNDIPRESGGIELSVLPDSVVPEKEVMPTAALPNAYEITTADTIPPHGGRGKRVATTPVGKKVVRNNTVRRKDLPRRKTRSTTKAKKRMTEKSKQASIARELTKFFNKRFNDGEFKHETPRKMRYDEKLKTYSTRILHPNTGKAITRKEKNVKDCDALMVEYATNNPNIWVGPSLGDS